MMSIGGNLAMDEAHEYVVDEFLPVLRLTPSNPFILRETKEGLGSIQSTHTPQIPAPCGMEDTLGYVHNSSSLPQHFKGK